MIYLTASEVERRFEILGISHRFSNDEKALYDTMRVVDRPPGVFGFPTSINASGLNILNVREILGIDPRRPPSFFDHPWYLQEEFAHHDCGPGLHFLHIEPLMDSISQSFDYECRLEAQGLELPTAIEVILMLFLHHVGTQENLLFKKHAWCRDLASLTRHVTVGAFGRNGVFISGHPREFASRGLGICPKLKKPPVVPSG